MMKVDDFDFKNYKKQKRGDVFFQHLTGRGDYTHGERRDRCTALPETHEN